MLLARLDLSRAKHRSLAGHSRWSRRIAAQIPFYDYDDHRFFRADDPPEAIAVRRSEAFADLAALYRMRFAETVRETAKTAAHVSDLQFTNTYRVPFQFSRNVRKSLPSGAFWASTDGVTVTDLDGNRFYDLSGSYGVNVFGHDFYKACIAEAEAAARPLGPILGGYHRSVAANVERLSAISGQDEVSFHMSGTEAVMQAVRLARYHTGRSHLVRFCGAYHGWWGDVQPGIGNPSPARETYTLAEMSERTLRVLQKRRDIACVLVNPLQALHPNATAPSDGALVDSSRHAGFDRRAYTEWLHELRRVCTERGIVLIMDEVFSGFRLARGGAQEYFGVRADLVTYGKTLGGGLPIGALCGSRALMKRFRDDRPADICFARGTFNSHPYVMAAMAAFLDRLDTASVAAIYDGLDQVWDQRAAALDARLAEAGLPVRIANLSSIWVVLYTRPSRYNWMFQYYLRADGLALGWTGTGRLIFSLDYTSDDIAEVADRFVRAAEAMERDGWWWSAPQTTNKKLRRAVLWELLKHRFGAKRPPSIPAVAGSRARSGATGEAPAAVAGHP
jgi:glutamate-1-semialdehyde 2,1-aminomutase